MSYSITKQALSMSIDKSIGFTRAHKFTLVQVASFKNKKTGLCCPSMKKLVDLLGYSKRHIQDTIVDLIAMGYLSKEQRFDDKGNGRQTSNEYEFPNFMDAVQCMGEGEAHCTPSDEAHCTPLTENLNKEEGIFSFTSDSPSSTKPPAKTKEATPQKEKSSFVEDLKDVASKSDQAPVFWFDEKCKAQYSQAADHSYWDDGILDIRNQDDHRIAALAEDWAYTQLAKNKMLHLIGWQLFRAFMSYAMMRVDFLQRGRRMDEASEERNFAHA